MVIPENVQVGPILYTVIVDDTMERYSNSMAQVNFSLQRMCLRAQQGPDQMRDSLLHEVMHAAIRNIGHEDGGDEQLVSGLTTELLDTFRRNPDLVAYLTAED